MGNPDFRGMGAWWESAYDDGRSMDEPLDWRVDPANKVDVVLPDGSAIEAYLCPWLTHEHSSSGFDDNIGFFKVRYKECRAAYIEGQQDFSVCALLADGIWRKCESHKMLRIGFETGAYEQ